MPTEFRNNRRGTGTRHSSPPNRNINGSKRIGIDQQNLSALLPPRFAALPSHQPFTWAYRSATAFQSITFQKAEM